MVEVEAICSTRAVTSAGMLSGCCSISSVMMFSIVSMIEDEDVSSSSSLVSETKVSDTLATKSF